MGDFHFRCLGCQQSLVADESGAGVSFLCPHCNTAQIIPTTPSRSVSTQSPQEDGKSVSVQPNPAQPNLPFEAGGHWVTQERLWKNEHQSTEQAVAIVERDQRISALRAECDWLASQLDEERQRRQPLELELDLARGEWAAAEKRAAEMESGLHHASSRLRQAELSLQELSDQLVVVKGERSDALVDLAHHQDSLAELNTELKQARAERTEAEEILGRARIDLDRAVTDLAAAESLAEHSSAEAAELKSTLSLLRTELAQAAAERDRLQALVSEDHELSDFAELKGDFDRMDIELRETQVRLDAFREKVDALTEEREALKRERTELQLKVAALRDAHDDTQLQQDNEVLRRMVERLNEELRDAQPEISRKKRRDATGGVVGGLARAVASRVFVPDPDVAEGR